MNRKDWVWVVVKTFGVYFGMETVLTVPSLLMVFTSRIGSEPAFLGLLSGVVIKAALSFYLLKSGRLIFRLIGIDSDPSAPAA